MARPDGEEFRIDIDVEHAQREAERVREMLAALRRRHDLSRYEYTSIVRIMPGGDTFAHPVLTLGNRFADSEDLLLSTYLHEQMHWYLWYLGTPDRDMVAPFYDELVRRYPDAPIELPDGARNYDATYTHLVVNWLEIAATSEFIGRERAFAVARANAQLPLDLPHRAQGLGPAGRALRAPRHRADPHGRSAEAGECQAAAPPSTAGGEKSRAAAPRRASPRSRRTPRGRGGRTAG